MSCAEISHVNHIYDDLTFNPSSKLKPPENRHQDALHLPPLFRTFPSTLTAERIDRVYYTRLEGMTDHLELDLTLTMLLLVLQPLGHVVVQIVQQRNWSTTTPTHWKCFSTNWMNPNNLRITQLATLIALVSTKLALQGILATPELPTIFTKHLFTSRQ